jgi:hypothetical protein
MSAAALLVGSALERLTPHDLVTYFRCPHELELSRSGRPRPSFPQAGGLSLAGVCTPLDVVPLPRSPLEAPPVGSLPLIDGRLDVLPGDSLVYVDEGEREELPMLFAAEQLHPDPLFRRHGSNLIDDELGISGRPDFIVRRSDGSMFPVEYKATHPFHGLHETHGRSFDLIQVIAECRLVEAMTARRPACGVLLYGDVAGEGAHEGWFQVPYGDREAAWLRNAITMVRADHVRAPVPGERNCATCPPHRDGLCRYAACRYAGGDSARDWVHARRY